MTLAQLSYLVAVDTHRHFVKAAEHCHVTQPTLSMQLQKLERQLRVEIFDRSKQPVEPTDLGKLIIIQARVVLREAGRIKEIINESSGEIAGELRIGIIPTLAPYLLPRFVTALTKNQPGLSLTVEELRTEAIIEGIQTDRLDAGVVASSIDRPGVTETMLFEEPFVGYVADSHRLYAQDDVHVSDLRLEDLWLLNEGHCFRDQVVELCQERQPVGGAKPLHFESGNLETLIRMVDSGGGMTLLPKLATDGLTAEEGARVRVFTGPVPTRRVRLITARAYLKRSLLDAFLQEMMDALPDTVDRIDTLSLGSK